MFGILRASLITEKVLLCHPIPQHVGMLNYYKHQWWKYVLWFNDVAKYILLMHGDLDPAISVGNVSQGQSIFVPNLTRVFIRFDLEPP